jgi:hypothetical protein
VQARARKVHDGRDAIGLDGLAGKILRALEVCSGVSTRQARNGMSEDARST